MGKSKREKPGSLYQKFSSDYITFFHEMLHYAGQGLPPARFLTAMAGMLMELSGSDSVEIRIIEHAKLIRVRAGLSKDEETQAEIIPKRPDDSGSIVPRLDAESDFEQLCEYITRGRLDKTAPCFTQQGSFFISNADRPVKLSLETGNRISGKTLYLRDDYTSLAIVAFGIDSNEPGLLIFRSEKESFFTEKDTNALEELAQMVQIASSHCRAQEALRERVKELTCLYEIAKVAARPNMSPDRIATEVLGLLPPGWFYPDITTARIILDGQSYALPNFDNRLQKLSADIIVDDQVRGSIEVAYLKEMPELDEGPFLKEERNLINAVAHELSQIIERHYRQEEQRRLQDQLRHADRLATIGQLAAGVAHELNEPLGSILGFAQLVKKTPRESNQVQRDIEKIEAASLHAREVVKKLLIFARQTSQKVVPVNLSEVVTEGLYFLESRCTKAGIKLVKDLAQDLPNTVADKSQLYQVLVNFVVNAIQAMPDGGEIIIKTALHKEGVALIVKDTGAGIKKDLLDKIFIPFFTTKDVNEGTGLGLAVVHGIVSAHRGRVTVESKVGKGTKFTVVLPIENPEQTGSGTEAGHV